MSSLTKYTCTRCNLQWESAKYYFMCPKCKCKSLLEINDEYPEEGCEDIEDADI